MKTTSRKPRKSSIYGHIVDAMTKVMHDMQVAGAAMTPATIAMRTRLAFGDRSADMHIEWASIEHLKNIAGKQLARRFDPDRTDSNPVYQNDMFSGELQFFYPVSPSERLVDEETGKREPVYVPLEQITRDTWDWNLATMAKKAHAINLHYAAFRAWGESQQW